MTDSALLASFDALAEAFALVLKRPEAALGLSPAEIAFITQVHADYIPGEMAGTSIADLAANLADFWGWAGKRDGAEPLIRRVRAKAADRSPLPYDRLEILQTDSPFLVDSVMGEIADQGLPVRAMYHAVVSAIRSPSGARAKGWNR